MKLVCIVLFICVCLVTSQATTNEQEEGSQQTTWNEEGPVVQQLLQESIKETEEGIVTEDIIIEEEVEEIEVEQMIAQKLSPHSFSGYGTIPTEKLEKTMTLEVCKKIKLLKDTLEAANEFTDDYFSTAAASLVSGVADLISTIGESEYSYQTEAELTEDSTSMQTTIDSLSDSHMDNVKAELDAEYEKYGCPELEKDPRNKLFLKKVWKGIKHVFKKVGKVVKKIGNGIGNVIKAPFRIIGGIANLITGAGKEVVEVIQVTNVNTNINDIDITNILNGNNCLSIPPSCKQEFAYMKPGGDKNLIIELACDDIKEVENKPAESSTSNP